MFASFSAFVSLLMLASSANLVSAKMTRSLSTNVNEEMIPFNYIIDFNITDSEADHISNTTIIVIDDCIVSSFNRAHNISEIKLIDATVTEVEVVPVPSGSKEEAKLSSEGNSNYIIRGSTYGSGSRCRRCRSKDNMVGNPDYTKWQNELDLCLVNSAHSATTGLDGVTSAKLSADTVNASLAVAQDDMFPFEFTIDLAANDFDSNKIVTLSGKTSVEGCIVSSFNEVHEPKVIQISDATLLKLETKPTTMTLLRGSLISNAHYVLSGEAWSVGGSFNHLKSMLGSPVFVEWQNALVTCIATSGVDGLVGVTDVTMTLVSNDAVASEE